MTFLLAWIAFPVVLAALGAGLGLLVELLCGARLPGPLLLPVGLAGALVVAAALTTNGATAPFTVPIVAVLALLGLSRARPVLARWPRPGWPLLAALGVLLAYGAPVLATGTTSIAGYHRLDDTSTWLAITDHLFAHGRSTAGLIPSSYKLNIAGYLSDAAYPIGAFMLLGIGRGLVGLDVAWVFQPYVACAGAALALCIYELCTPLVPSRPLRAFVAFLAAQPALLYGVSQWGAIKEVTASFLLALLCALTVPLMRRAPPRRAALLPSAIAAAALILTFGPGTAVWIVPALGLVALTWLVPSGRGGRGMVGATVSIGWLAGVTLALSLPVWFLLAQSLRTATDFVGSSAAAIPLIRLGTLFGPLSGFQLAGIWPIGDFRNPLATSFSSVALIGLVLAVGAIALAWTVRAGHFGLALYAGAALAGCIAIVVADGVPWIVAKLLAIASPAILLTGLAGGAILWARSRIAGAIVLAAIAGGVLWSNALAYHDEALAPVGPFAELAHIGSLVSGQGPTLINDYEIYADRYFLRAGAPVEPADAVGAIALRSGAVLQKPSSADLDSYSPVALLPYRSIVIARTPAASRPPAAYRLRWEGRYYELWQRAPHPTVRILSHVPFGDARTNPYCGQALDGRTGRPLPPRQVCPIQPAAPAPCPLVRSIASFALRAHAQIVAAERPPVVYARADDLRLPPGWIVSRALHQIVATAPGRIDLKVSIDRSGRFALWLGGSFARGFAVAFDGRLIGRVHNLTSTIDGYAPVAVLPPGGGVHTITLSYSGFDLAPGNGDKPLSTVLSSVVLEPTERLAPLTTLRPQQATSLCGKSVDWIEVVAPIAP